MSIEGLQKLLQVNFYRHFGSSKEAYRAAKLQFLSKSLKRRVKKREAVVQYVRKHHEATQWELNRECKTHVQDIFKGGVREAFRTSGVRYPKERLNVHGSAVKEIRSRSTAFEKDIINKLELMGAKAHVKTASGIADAVIQLNGNTYVIEIKDYRSKPVSLTEVKQISKYLNDLKCRKGIVICSGDRKVRKVSFQSKDILIVPERYTTGLEGVIKDNDMGLAKS